MERGEKWSVCSNVGHWVGYVVLILVLVLFVWLNLGSGSIDLSQRSKGGERWWVMRIWFAEWGKRWSIGSNVGHWVGYAGADTDALDKVG